MKPSPPLLVVRIEPLEARIAPAFVTGTVDLSSLSAGTGTKIAGLAAGDSTGQGVSDAGDVNGDGFDDFIIGASGAAGQAFDGAAYVIFGKSGGLPAAFDLSTLDGTNGFRIDGHGTENLGRRVSGVGDFNGDGFADVIVGAPGSYDAGNHRTGAAYVIFGHAGPFSAVLKTLTLTAAQGIKFQGEAAGDAFGYTVSGAGDFNDDGLADVVVGAFTANSAAGAAYVFFGKAGGLASPVNASGLTDATGIKLAGEAAGDQLGYSVSGVGDVNGDGLADLAVGARGANGYDGAAYVVFGTKSSTTPFPLSSLNGDNGFKLKGDSARQAGYSVSTAGDLNGDGLADLVVGAPGGDTGKAYVIYGKRTIFTNPLNLSALDGHNGFSIAGEAMGDGFGAAVRTAGDVNGDGLADLIVGAVHASPHGASSGASYVIFGKSGAMPFGATLSLSTLQGPTGFKLQGEATKDYAYSVSAAGDVNGDGFGDLLVGAQGQSPAGKQNEGAAYIVYGGPSGAFIDPMFSNMGKTAKFTDVDGDLVTVTVSKGSLDKTNFELLAKTPGSAQAQLLLLDVGIVAGMTSEFDGATVSITAKTPAGGHGNGKVNVGFINAANTDLGAVTVSGDLGGMFVGDAGDDIGLKSLTVGSVDVFEGRTGDTGSAQELIIAGPAGPVKVAGDFGHALLQVQVATVATKASLASISIGGSLLGGARLEEGAIVAQANIGPVTIGHDLRGGTGDSSGSITAGGSLGGVKIGGSLEGGAGLSSGNLQAGTTVASLTIGGDLRGGAGENSATVLATKSVGKVKIGGSLIGGAGRNSALLDIGSTQASITIGGDILGGTSEDSGRINSSGALGAVKIGGSLLGGSAPFTGVVQAVTAFGSLTIGGDYQGGPADGSGQIISSGPLGAVKIGGELTGGGGGSSGEIFAGGNLGKVSIGRSLTGGAVTTSGLIFSSGNLAGVTIGGNAIAGKAAFSGGGIVALGTLGPVSVKGDVRGTAANPFTIRGGGPLTGSKSMAIASVKVGGDLEHVQILGGFGNADTLINGHAQIGAITVGGDWIASSVTAGVLSDMTFAAGGPSGVVASLASITIKGRALGTIDPGDRFSITAEQIGSITIAGKKIALTTGKSNDLTPIPLGDTPDFAAVEILRT